MIEITENRLLEIINDISEHFTLNITIESLNEKQEILNQIKAKDIDIHKAISDYILLFESYHFIKTDRILMFKARDIWKMEVDSFKDELVKSDNELHKLLHSKGIKKT